MSKCARTVCPRDGTEPHRFLPGLYCLSCAKLINAGARGLPGYTGEMPFDLGDSVQENKNPPQYKTNTGELVPKKCACGADLAELHASGKEGHLCSAVATPRDKRCRGEWRDGIHADGEREVARCYLKENHDQACQSRIEPRGLWPQVISGEALERAAVKFTEATRKLAEFEHPSNRALIGILGAKEEAGLRRRYLRAATYDHVAALLRQQQSFHEMNVAEELELEAERLRKETP